MMAPHASLRTTTPPPLPPLRHRRSLGRVSIRERRATSLSPRRPQSTPASSARPHRGSPPLLEHAELRCAICFDMLCFPVTLPCGHNFDRGCLLTAWHHEPVPTAANERDVAIATATATGTATGTATAPRHACPLCRRRPSASAGDLQVNLLLKKLIARQFPVEMGVLEREDTKRHVTKATAPVAIPAIPTPAPVATAHPQPLPSERRARTWRTAASFFYVWLASVTEPPGFVLAVLLLLSLLALAVTPQQMLTNASTLPTLFEAMDHVLNASLLLVREIGARTDALDLAAAWRVLEVFAFLL